MAQAVQHARVVVHDGANQALHAAAPAIALLKGFVHQATRAGQRGIVPRAQGKQAAERRGQRGGVAAEQGRPGRRGLVDRRGILSQLHVTDAGMQRPQRTQDLHIAVMQVVAERTLLLLAQERDTAYLAQIGADGVVDGHISRDLGCLELMRQLLHLLVLR